MSDLSHFWWQAGDDGPNPGLIGNSLRFRGAQHLAVTNSGSSDNYLFSLWVKRGSLIGVSTGGCIFGRGNDNKARFEFTDDALYTNNSSGGTSSSGSLYRDPSAWYHIVIKRSTALGVNRCYVWVNGQVVSRTNGNGYLDTPGALLGGTKIGATGSNTRHFDGYMAEIHAIDGADGNIDGIEYTDFGEFNADGVWVPKDVSISTADYGSAGFYLDFSDPADIGADRSGNGNNFTASGFELTNTSSTSYDWVADSPTNNFAVVNPLYHGASTSNANLTTANATGKPTILGLAGNGWNGTESGWTTTGNVDFGQRTAADKICTAKLPAVTITNPSDHYTTILDSGANILGKAQAKFSSGLWWIKDRVGSNEHQFVDVLNGNNVKHCPAQTPGAYAAPSGNSIAWCWSAPDSFTPTVSVGATGVSGRRNVDAGFSIMKFTPNTFPYSVTHGLSKTPEFVIMTNRTFNNNLFVYHKDGGTTGSTWLNSGSAWDPSSSIWSSSHPDSSVIHLGSTADASNDMTLYAWHSVPGYSAMGSWDANGVRDGAFIYLGFRPAFLLYKVYNAASNWGIRSSAQSPYNPSDKWLYANGTAAEATGLQIDLLSNGFKWREDGGQGNNSGQKLLYVAFAEHPFGGSNCAPSPAR